MPVRREGPCPPDRSHVMAHSSDVAAILSTFTPDPALSQAPSVQKAVLLARRLHQRAAQLDYQGC